MAPLYEKLCAQHGWPVDHALLTRLRCVAAEAATRLRAAGNRFPPLSCWCSSASFASKASADRLLLLHILTLALYTTQLRCREKNAADLAKADASIAEAREKFGDVEVFDRQIEKAQLVARTGDMVSHGRRRDRAVGRRKTDSQTQAELPRGRLRWGSGLVCCQSAFSPLIAAPSAHAYTRTYIAAPSAHAPHRAPAVIRPAAPLFLCSLARWRRTPTSAASTSARGRRWTWPWLRPAWPCSTGSTQPPRSASRRPRSECTTPPLAAVNAAAEQLAPGKLTGCHISICTALSVPLTLCPPAICRLNEKGGDWDRRNRLKVYEGMLLAASRDFAGAATLLLDSVATFTAHEVMSYTQFINYTVLTSLKALERVPLKRRVVDSPDVLSSISDVPHLSELLNAFYEGRYRDFLTALTAIYPAIASDRYLARHAPYYLREMRLAAYAQFLQSYKRCASSAAAFGVLSAAACVRDALASRLLLSDSYLSLAFPLPCLFAFHPTAA